MTSSSPAEGTTGQPAASASLATPDNTAALQRVRDASGFLTAHALQRIDGDLDWYRDLSAQDRSYVGMVAQAGIHAFVAWFADPHAAPSDVGEMFAAAPRELTQTISLQHALQLVRVIVDVVEEHSARLSTPETERDLREAVLRYSREVAFSAAEVYARAAEMRGAWDARLEALAVDALVRGDSEDEVRSRISALGWSGKGQALVMVGTTPADFDESMGSDLRRAARRVVSDALVGIHEDQIVIVLAGTGDLIAAASSLTEYFAPGPVVIGGLVSTVAEASRSAAAAVAGLSAAPAWPQAPRPVLADDLLPERVLIGDDVARKALVTLAFEPLQAASGQVLETLSAYLSAGRSLEAAARDLFVHPNTVRYRLRKVTEITGWDPLDARESFVLQIALALGLLP